jgi:hypothetical protein
MWQRHNVQPQVTLLAVQENRGSFKEDDPRYAHHPGSVPIHVRVPPTNYYFHHAIRIFIAFNAVRELRGIHS